MRDVLRTPSSSKCLLNRVQPAKCPRSISFLSCSGAWYLSYTFIALEFFFLLLFLAFSHLSRQDLILATHTKKRCCNEEFIVIMASVWKISYRHSLLSLSSNLALVSLTALALLLSSRLKNIYFQGDLH